VSSTRRKNSPATCILSKLWWRCSQTWTARSKTFPLNQPRIPRNTGSNARSTASTCTPPSRRRGSRTNFSNRHPAARRVQRFQRVVPGSGADLGSSAHLDWTCTMRASQSRSLTAVTSTSPRRKQYRPSPRRSHAPPRLRLRRHLRRRHCLPAGR
jgi:hypothetical protein